MKRALWIILGLAVLVAIAIPVSNLFAEPPKVAFAEGDAHEELAAVAPVFAAKCADCHTTEGRTPFYASLPVAGSLIRQDVETGLENLDLDRAFAHGLNEAALAKIEYALMEDSMPPARYVALHWDAGLSKDERQEILKWVRETRAARFAPEGLPTEVAQRVIQPLPQKVEADPAKVALGTKLFHDPRLSADNSLSCASCHSLTKGGTDREPVSTGVGGAKGPINSPTVYNAVFNLAQFWDGRAADLKEQAGGPVHNPKEMGTNWDDVITKLSEDEDFVAEYQAVYGDEITGDNLQDAIATFESTLVTPNSPFDRYLLGDTEALDAQARRGWEIFQEAGCTTCHVGKAMGGQSYEKMGLVTAYFHDDVEDVDRGRFNVTKDDRDLYRFKVPTLRNVALTAPYFHDASARTLEKAVRTMAQHQTEERLSDEDVDAVVAFLQTLTGEYQGRPLN